MARKTKTILLVICCLLVLCLIVVLTCNQLVVSNAKGKAFSEIDSIIAVDTIELEHISKQDSFTMVYRQPINGYEVKAVVKLGEFKYYMTTKLDILKLKAQAALGSAEAMCVLEKCN